MERINTDRHKYQMLQPFNYNVSPYIYKWQVMDKAGDPTISWGAIGGGGSPLGLNVEWNATVPFYYLIQTELFNSNNQNHNRDVKVIKSIDISYLRDDADADITFKIKKVLRSTMATGSIVLTLDSNASEFATVGSVDTETYNTDIVIDDLGTYDYYMEVLLRGELSTSGIRLGKVLLSIAQNSYESLHNTKI